MTLNTVEDLNALPHGYAVVDSHDCAWQKINVTEPDDLPGVTVIWQRFGSKTAHTTADIVHWGPFEQVADRAFITPRTLRNVHVQGWVP